MTRSGTFFAISALAATIILAAHGVVMAKGSVVNSPHNLSANGGLGAHKVAYDEIRICVFCHTPHNALSTTLAIQPPLWNRLLPPDGQSYTMYGSDTFNQNVNPLPSAPTDASRVCLSCHDGTLALDSYGGKVLHAGSVNGTSPLKMPSDVNSSLNANLTTDLSDDHPISFPYTSDLATKMYLVDPGALPSNVKLDLKGYLQCTACHDPHDNEYGNFLVMNNGDATKPDYNPTVTSPLCVACHTPPGWDNTSPHYAGAGCLNCHVTHTAPVKQYLLNAPVSDTCYSGTGCHGSSNPPQHTLKAAASMALGASAAGFSKAGGEGGEENGGRGRARATDLQTVFNQSLYRHPIGSSGTSYKVNEQLPLRKPRVECVDCHNVHVAGSTKVMAGGIKRSLQKVKGISKDSLGTVDATSEYQICYKCHSGPFAYKFLELNKQNRQINEPDELKRFDPGNPSFHPVAANRRGNGASLLAQYQSSMITIECTDCHNSDQSSKAGGNGPNGPHGSRYEHILLARYDMPVRGAAGRASSCSSYRSDYALCFTCHAENYVMITGTSFIANGRNEHAAHVVDRCIPCFACHDPHGVPAQDGGSQTGNAHLINFDRGYAASKSMPTPRYSTLSPGSGNCAVACHSAKNGYHSYPQDTAQQALRFRP